MPTNRQIRQEREMKIMETLALLDLATRSQLQQIHSLGSNRNASRVLKNMDQYLNSFTDIEKVYYLNAAGRELAGAKKVVTKTSQYTHTLMRTDMYIHFGCPKHWINEYSLPKLTADAVFMHEGRQYFLEVDHKQKLKANIHKLKEYFRFKETGLWQKKNNGTFPTVLFYTLTSTRKAQLLESDPGLNLQVITKEDLH
jgi:Replication-relaxation